MFDFSKALPWIELARPIVGAILAAKGVPADVTTKAVDTMGEAEIALGDGTGDQKLQAVLNGVADVMTAKKANTTTITAVQDVVAKGISDGIGIANDIHEMHTSTVQANAAQATAAVEAATSTASQAAAAAAGAPVSQNK